MGCGRRCDAGGVAGDVAKPDQLQNDDEFLPWAKVIVRFECLKARRTAARDRHWFSDEVFDLLADSESESGTADDELLAEREALDGCLGKMDESQRELVLLLYRGHGEVADLAEESGRSVNALCKKIRRLREKLGKCIGEQLLTISPGKELS